MSKNKCESQLEKITEERDHWRKIAIDRQSEIENLKRQLERFQIHASILGVDTIQRYRYDQVIERLQVERDQARHDANRVCGAIEREAQSALDQFNRSGQLYREEFQKILQVSEEQRASHLTHQLISAAVSNEAVVSENWEKLNTQLIEMGTNTNPYQHPEAAIARTQWIRFWDGVRFAGAYGLLLRAHGFSDDPSLIVDEVLRECRVAGKPDMRTLQRLSIQWIQDNLPEPPSQHLTLAEGLEIHQQEINSKLSRKQYAHKIGMSEKQLSRYKGWYTALNEFAKLSPNEYITRLKGQGYE
jgi:hypothetical protein